MQSSSVFQLPSDVAFSLGYKPQSKVGLKRNVVTSKKATSKENAKVDVNMLDGSESPSETCMDYESFSSISVNHSSIPGSSFSDPIFKFVPTAFSKEFFGENVSAADIFGSTNLMPPPPPPPPTLATRQNEGGETQTDTNGPKVDFKIGANVKAKKKFNHSAHKPPHKLFEDSLKPDPAPKWWTDNVSSISVDDYDFPEQSTSMSTASSPTSSPSFSPKNSVQPDQKSDTSPYEKAHEHVDQQLRETADVYRKEGRSLYEAEQYLRAYEAFSKCLQVCPAKWTEIPGVLGNRAAVLMMLDRYVEVIEDCEEALTISPGSLNLLDRKGRAQIRLGLLAEADSTFQELLELSLDAEDNSITEKFKKMAHLGSEQIIEARLLVGKLGAWVSKQSKANDQQFLSQAEQLISLCPQFRSAHAFKVHVLCKLHRWDEAKMHAEHVSLDVHPTIQKLFAHPSSSLPVPVISELQWSITEKPCGGNGIEADRAAIAGGMLCMGSQMAKAYFLSLKNLDVSKNHSNEAMDLLRRVLASLAWVTGSSLDWSWVSAASDQLRACIDLKSSGDEKFRAGNYIDAVAAYTDALKKDHEALRWNAVLFANRAAAYINMHRYHDAVNDCNQALTKDSGYIKALLRRARANKVCKLRKISCNKSG